jgi:hypothetical protein
MIRFSCGPIGHLCATSGKIQVHKSAAIKAAVAHSPDSHCRARGQLAILGEHGRQHGSFLGRHGALPRRQDPKIGVVERVSWQPSYRLGRRGRRICIRAMWSREGGS